MTAAERSSLQALIAKGKVAAQKRIHAQILLKADASPEGDGWKDQQIVEAFVVGRCTVERVRQRFVKGWRRRWSASRNKTASRASSTAWPRPS